MQTADVIVVGGGCIGASAAMHLASRRIGRVILVERHSLASGTTGKSTAILRQHYGTRLMARLARESLEVFRNFPDAVGGTAGFVQTGYVIVVDQADRPALEHNVALQRSVGVETFLLEPEDIQELAPGIYTDDVAAGAYEPETGYADPHLTTLAFAERAREGGARILQHTLVREVLVDRGKVRGVSTSAGEIKAPVVLLAAGVWGARLAARVGWQLPVVATRHPICIFKRPGAVGPQPIIGDRISMSYLRPERDLTLVGSMDPRDNDSAVDPDSYSAGVTSTEVEVAAARFAHRFPAARESAFTGGYAGIYDATPDLQPILDACPSIAGLYCSLGFSGHGFKFSPIIGRLIANLITEQGANDPALDLFSSERFANGQFIRAERPYRRVPGYQ